MNSYFDTEEFREVLRLYEQQLADGETPYFDADDFADLADYYLSCDQPDLAMEAVDLGLSVHEDDEVLLTVKAATFIYRHEYATARQLLEDNELDDNDNLYQRAQLVYAIDNDLQKAQQMFRDWMKKELERSNVKDRDNISRDSYLHIISSFVELHDESLNNEEYIAVVRTWIDEYIEKFQPLGRNDIDVQVMDICRNNNLAAQLVRGLTQVLEEQPYLQNGWSTLALGHFTLEQYGAALEACDFALAINQHDMEAMLTKAYSYNLLGHRNEACSMFEQYMAEPNHDDAQGVPFCECLINNNRADEALPYLNRGVRALVDEYKNHVFTDDEYSRRYVTALLDAAALYQTLEQYSLGEECLQHILKVAPDDAETLFMLGNMQLSQKNVNMAIATYAKALQGAQSQVVMAIDIALTMVMNDYDDMALELLEMVESSAKKEPYYSASIRNLPAVKALTYLKLGRFSQFLECFRQAVDSTPDLVRSVFIDYFPSNLSVDEYYEYAVAKVKELMERNKDVDDEE